MLSVNQQAITNDRPTTIDDKGDVRGNVENSSKATANLNKSDNPVV